MFYLRVAAFYLAVAVFLGLGIANSERVPLSEECLARASATACSIEQRGKHNMEAVAKLLDIIS
jgi:hypothetical protein